MASKLSFDGIWDWNLLTNEFFLGEGFKELFGYDLNKNEDNIRTNWSTYLYPEDKEVVEKGLSQAIASSASQWELAYRFVRADGSIAKVFNRASIIRDADGKACRIVGAIQDISKQNVLEERLEREIRLKEKQIADAMAEAREAERSDIGKELHDNVNQLLGASRLYLNMAKRGGEDTEMFLGRSSEYTLTAIEEIRKLTKGLTTDVIKNLGLCESIKNVTRDTMEVNPVKINFTFETVKEEILNDKFKLNVFRIVQEQLNNILKHAGATKVTISLSQDEISLMLTIADDGIGFDTGKKRDGIGIDNIKSRAAAYSGTADFISQRGGGCILNVKFPVTNVMLRKS
jgi:PAS domain S-box-containing protein